MKGDIHFLVSFSVIDRFNGSFPLCRFQATTRFSIIKLTLNFSCQHVDFSTPTTIALFLSLMLIDHLSLSFLTEQLTVTSLWVSLMTPESNISVHRNARLTHEFSLQYRQPCLPANKSYSNKILLSITKHSRLQLHYK